MKALLSDEIARYAHEHTSGHGALLDELRAHTLAEVPMSQMQIGRVEGALLGLLVRLLGAKRIIEIGCYTGYSALCMAAALPDDGELLTLDHSEAFTAVARAFFARSPHGGKIELRLGDALDTLRGLDVPPFDMAFVDADKARYPAYYAELLPRLRPGGLLVVDNALWSGQVLAPESDDARGIAALNDRVQADPRVDNVLLTVRDGVMLVYKRAAR